MVLRQIMLLNNVLKKLIVLERR